MSITATIVGAVLGCAAILPGCGAAIDHATQPAPVEHVIHAGESPGDVNPPDTITVLGITLDECDQQGGTLTLRGDTTACENVDY